jgi:hypothetical protein
VQGFPGLPQEKPFKGEQARNSIYFKKIINSMSYRYLHAGHICCSVLSNQDWINIIQLIRVADYEIKRTS